MRRLGLLSLAVRRELILAFALAVGCLLARLVNIDRYTGSYAEGVRAEQLLLMSAGFRPFRDIFSDQGPLLLQVFYPGYVLFGGSLIGVRAASLFASLVGLAGVYWLGRQLAGPVAALAGLLLLGASPLYLYLSRVAVAELVALAPAILAFGCAVRFSRQPRARWLYGSAVLLAASVLVKPIAFATAVPIALAVASVHLHRWRNLLLMLLVAAAVVLIGVMLVGLQDILNQIVQFRLASRRDAGWRPLENLGEVATRLSDEGPVLLGFAVAGAAFAARHRAGWPLLAWAVVGAATLIVHTPLHTKHNAVLVVPLAGLAAYGVARVVAWASLPTSRRPRLGHAGLAVGLGLCLLASVPVLSRDWALLTKLDNSERDKSFPWYSDGAETIRRVVASNEYLVTDHAYLAYAASRLVPPPLAEASATRVHAGSLTDALAIDITDGYRARAVVLWASKLDDLRKYRAWVRENYVPVKVWAAEEDTRPVLWLRNDERLEAGRAAMQAGLAPAPAGIQFGGWRLDRVGLDRRDARPGETITVTLEWSLVGVVTPAPEVVLSLVDSSNRTVDEEHEFLLLGTGSPGWLQWVGGLPAPAKAAPGEYHVRAMLLDMRGRALGPPATIGTVTLQAR